MPRKTKEEELKKWLMELNMYMFQVETEFFKGFVFGSADDSETIETEIYKKYPNCTCKMISKVTEIIIK